MVSVGWDLKEVGSQLEENSTFHLIIAIVFYVPDMFLGLRDIIQPILLMAAIILFVIGLGFFGIGTH